MKDRLKEARKRAKKKKDFYGSLTAYAMTIPFLFFINMMSYHGHFWFIYPALGWGFGLTMQYWDAFGKGHLSDGWEDRQVEKELDAMDRNRRTPSNMDDHLDLRELEHRKEKEPQWREDDLV